MRLVGSLTLYYDTKEGFDDFKIMAESKPVPIGFAVGFDEPASKITINIDTEVLEVTASGK